jgi:hypothetical protein
MTPKYLKDNFGKHRLPEPEELDFCAEFRVDSQSLDPEAGGTLDVRVEPGRMGMRWAGESLWTWIEWHEILIVLGRCLNQSAAEVVAEARELAYEEGLAAGIKEVFDERVLEKEATIRLVRRSKLTKFPPPDGAA